MKLIGAFIGAALIILSTTTTAQALNAQEVYDKVNRSVYTLYTVNFYDKKPESLGSAIAVTDHILATNCHVALTGNYLGIVINNEFKLGTLFFRDTNRDICFVEVPGIKFTPVKIRDSKDVKVGEAVYAVGNPEGLEKSISQGIISNKRQDRGGFVLQTDAVVSFGSSGGGLFDQNGLLVGITNSVDKYSRNIAFAIPSEWISQILFPKALAAQKTEEKVIGKFESRPEGGTKTLKKLGAYGKAGVTVYQYNQRCFILLTGKNDFGEAVSSAIWYPEKPGIILIFPSSIDVPKDFKIMNAAFYENKESQPVYSKDSLFFGDKKYQLVGIRDENGNFPLLVTKLPENVKDQLPQLQNFILKHTEGVTPNYRNITFDLDGFKEALTAYEKNCKAAAASSAVPQ